MTKLTLTNNFQGTLLENEFIDKYMPEANGEYVKVYLLLLRYMNDPTTELSVSKIADILDHTEKDVLRALNYWKKQGLIDFETKHSEKKPVLPAVVEAVTEEKKVIRKKESNPRNRKELKELLFVAEQYLGKTLTKTDIDTIIYFYDELGMSADLIEYLIEYCVENGHKSIHYIQKVALSWSEQKITTVEAAKSSTVMYNKNCYSILNAYGIKGRAPATTEITYIRRWNEEYAFSLDLILEACNRTMNAIHQPSFEYTDTILKKWLEKGVRTLQDVAIIDEMYQKEKAEKKQESSPRTPTPNPIPKTKKNKFNNFEGRTYDNMDELTRKLIMQ